MTVEYLSFFAIQPLILKGSMATNSTRQNMSYLEVTREKMRTMHCVNLRHIEGESFFMFPRITAADSVQAPSPTIKSPDGL